MPLPSQAAIPFPPVGHTTAAGGTAFVALVPPWPGPAGSPSIYQLVNNVPNWMGPSGYFTRLTTLLYTSGATAHKLGIVRPLNWTTVASAAAAAQAVINISADPGVYTTNYRYPVPGVSPVAGLYVYPGRVANNAIAASDYCAYQLTDGSWVLDTVSSVATLAITMATNVPTGGVAAGAPFFFFGIITDSDPASGGVQPQTTTTASTNRINQIQDNNGAGIGSLHKGDPLMFYSPNGTNAGILDLIAGLYTKL